MKYSAQMICKTNWLYHRDSKEPWFCSPAKRNEENTEAVADQHAADGSMFYVFDEASAAPDLIFEVAEVGLSDGHPFMFLYGNPTRSTGKFYRVSFGSVHKSIDFRDSRMPNQELIAEWIETYGVYSNFVRVRVRAGGRRTPVHRPLTHPGRPEYMRPETSWEQQATRRNFAAVGEQ
jgi:hypothetical protein